VFAIRITGGGTTRPEFKKEPGLYFDMWRSVSPYPIPGPPVHGAKAQRQNSHAAMRPLRTRRVMQKGYALLGAMTMEILRSDAFALSVNS
jgi:hypothetical protein